MQGIGVIWTGKAVILLVSDAKSDAVMHSANCTMDATCAAQLADTAIFEHQLVVTVDNGPFLISFMVDGILCDGGTESVRGTCWMNNEVNFDLRGWSEDCAVFFFRHIITVLQQFLKFNFFAKFINHINHEISSKVIHVLIGSMKTYKKRAN